MSDKIHSLFGSPSGLYATEKCPARIAFGKDLPPLPDTEFSIEGTAFHDLMEEFGPLYLSGKYSLSVIQAALDKRRNKYEDMDYHVIETLKGISSLWKNFQAKHTECTIHYELRVAINEDIFGTADLVFTGTNNRTGRTDVVCLDYKYGLGVPVSAEKNLQGVAYGLGAITTLGLKHIGICMVIIAQVRLEDGWSRYTFEGDEIQMYWDKVLGIVEKAKAIYNEELPIEGNLHAGSHCKFCKCRAVCPAAKQEHYDALAVTATEQPVEHLIAKLTFDQQVAIFLKKSQIEDFLNAVANNVKATVRSGVSHPDVKLVSTAGRRTWDPSIDEADIVEKLQERGAKKIWKKKLCGITAIEKQKIDIDDLVVKSDGREELVPAVDRRPAIAHEEVQELPEE